MFSLSRSSAESQTLTSFSQSKCENLDDNSYRECPHWRRHISLCARGTDDKQRELFSVVASRQTESGGYFGLAQPTNPKVGYFEYSSYCKSGGVNMRQVRKSASVDTAGVRLRGTSSNMLLSKRWGKVTELIKDIWNNSG